MRNIDMTTRTEKEFAANQLRMFMKGRGYNTAKLAKQSGVLPGVISRILSENRDFKFSTAIKLAKGLHISLDALAGKKVVASKQLEDLRNISDKLSDLVWK